MTAELWNADTPEYEISKITRRQVAKNKHCGDIAGCVQVITDEGKTIRYLKRDKNLESKIEAYKSVFPECKIKGL